MSHSHGFRVCFGKMCDKPEENVNFQGMPAAPPSYDDSMAAGGAGGFAPPPPPGQMYPGLPGKEGAPPPPASYPAPQQPQAPVQVVTQVQYVAAPSFGYRPVTMTCPHCQAHVTTKTQSEPSVVAWIVGGLLCFVGFWPCACIPCCVDSMQQVTHSCPSCGNFLGRYKGGLWVWRPTEGKGGTDYGHSIKPKIFISG